MTIYLANELLNTCHKTYYSYYTKNLWGDGFMGYSYRCPRCGKVVEGDDRAGFKDELSQHFRDRHPGEDHPNVLQKDFT